MDKRVSYCYKDLGISPECSEQCPNFEADNENYESGIFHISVANDILDYLKNHEIPQDCVFYGIINSHSYISGYMAQQVLDNFIKEFFEEKVKSQIMYSACLKENELYIFLNPPIENFNIPTTCEIKSNYHPHCGAKMDE